MKNSYDEIEELFADIVKDIEETLSNEVLDEVKNIELEHIKTDVMQAYTPKIYDRRNSNGIDNPDNIIGTVHSMRLEAENVTPFNDGYGTYNHGNGLAELINDGDSFGGYFYDYPGTFNQPRPFIDNTVDEIESTQRVDDALVNGLKNKGYDIT